MPRTTRRVHNVLVECAAVELYRASFCSHTATIHFLSVLVCLCFPNIFFSACVLMCLCSVLNKVCRSLTRSTFTFPLPCIVNAIVQCILYTFTFVHFHSSLLVLFHTLSWYSVAHIIGTSHYDIDVTKHTQQWQSRWCLEFSWCCVWVIMLLCVCSCSVRCYLV